MLKDYCLEYRSNYWASLLVFALVYTAPMSIMAQSPEGGWTLEDTILRVIEIAPEIQGSQAEVDSRRGALQQAGAWPNPEIELSADDKIGIDTGTGGNDLTQFAFSQSLPISGRLGHQQSVAKAELDEAGADVLYQHILLESQVAQRFHALQLEEARLSMAGQYLQLADEMQDAGRRREQAGELSELERMRIDILRESVQQILDERKGEYEEALSRFRAYLGLSSEVTPQLTPLEPFGPVPALEELRSRLSEHPSLIAARYRLDAARSGVQLVRAERIPEPTLRLFREKDFLNGRRQDITGIGIAISVPLWDRKTGRLSEVRGRVVQAQSELQILERDIASNLQRSYLHLTHLVLQAEQYKTRILDPAQHVFDLTRRAYASGEVELLSLIDANDTYFNAHERYLELLQQSWLEAAELRLAAGTTLVTTK